MTTDNNNNMNSRKELRHVESMAAFPSGAGNIPHLNAVILGEALASEENDLIFPSRDFCSQALIPSLQKVSSLLFLSLCVRFYELFDWFI